MTTDLGPQDVCAEMFVIIEIGVKVQLLIQNWGYYRLILEAQGLFN